MILKNPGNISIGSFNLFCLCFVLILSPANIKLISAAVPRISTTPLSLNFGKVRVGDAPERSITIKNTGTLDLAISGVAITGTNISEFSQTNDCTTIPAGGSCTLTVTFTPALPFGSKSATVSISSNDPSRPNVIVKLLGNASPPKISLPLFRSTLAP